MYSCRLKQCIREIDLVYTRSEFNFFSLFTWAHILLKSFREKLYTGIQKKKLFRSVLYRLMLLLNICCKKKHPIPLAISLNILTCGLAA